MLKFWITRLSGIFLALTIFSACNSGGYTETSTGLKYKILRKKSKSTMQLNDFVELNLAYYAQDDTLLYDSKVLGNDFIIKVAPPSFVGGFEEGLLLLGEGDSAEFLLPADSVYEKLFQQPKPAFITTGTQLKFRLGVSKVMNEAAFQQRMQRKVSTQQNAEEEQIQRYLTENNIQAQPSSPGVYFVILKEGSGAIPVIGDSVEVKYTGKLLSGKVFDGSIKGGKNLFYRVGSGKYLVAWERAITSMPEGSLARLVLTSINAFGKSDKAPVPPDSPVVFDIELIRIIK